MINEHQQYVEQLENSVKCLMGYVMELHDFRNKLTSLEFKEDHEGLRNYIFMKFPMLQGSRNQRVFRELGENSNWDDVGPVVKALLEKKDT